jgi:hypothetical protein
MVYGATSLQIHSLMKERTYWFSIDSFNEGGISSSPHVVEAGGPWFAFDEETGCLSVWGGLIRPSHVARWQTVTETLILKQGAKLADRAFSGFANLAIVDALNSGLTSIPPYCFESCKRLLSIRLPAGITSIGDGAFYGCVLLIDTDLFPTKLTTIGYAAFMFCESLAGIYLPSSVKSIGESAFGYCQSVRRLDLHTLGLDSIKAGTFTNCSSLLYLSLPKSIKSIGRFAFSSCAALTAIDMGHTSVVEVGEAAFRGCSNLTAAVLPKGLIRIGPEAFQGDSRLRTLELADKVTDWGSRAFANCSAVTNFTFHGNGVGNVDCDVLREAFAPDVHISVDHGFTGQICGIKFDNEAGLLSKTAIVAIVVACTVVLCAAIVIIVKCTARKVEEEPLIQEDTAGYTATGDDA